MSERKIQLIKCKLIAGQKPRLSDCSVKPTARYERGLAAESATRRGRPKTIGGRGIIFQYKTWRKSLLVCLYRYRLHQ